MTDVAGKVLLGAGSKNDACRWYRMTVPAQAIGGDQILWADDILAGIGRPTLTDDEYLSLKAMVLQRQTSPAMVAVVRETIKTKGQRPKIIIELDDDLWSIPTGNPAFSYYDQRRLDNLGQMITMADKVIVSTASLADAISARFDRGVVVVPNSLPAGLEWANPNEVEPRPELLFSGGATHADDLMQASGSIRRAGYPVVLLGHDYRNQLPKARHMGWSKDVPDHYVRLRQYTGMTGLAPLSQNTFNVSKSAIRLMEYAMAGILPVATNYGPYADHPAVHVGKHEQWSRAIKRMHDMPLGEWRESLRVCQSWARTRVITEYIDAWKIAWEIA